MSKDKRSRTIHYKLAKTSQTTLTLQEMLESALEDESKGLHLVINRQEYLTDDQKKKRFLNKHSRYSGNMLMCQLVQYEAGLSQMIITLNEQAKAYQLKSLKPDDIKKLTEVSDSSDQESEFLNSVLYFGVYNNHMIVLGNQTLKTKELESHLNWFLMNTVNIISSSIVLCDQVSSEAKKKLKKQEVKSLVIGSDVLFEPPQDSDTKIVDFEEKHNEIKSLHLSPKTIGAEFFSFLRNVGQINSSALDEALDDANLKVNIEVTYNRTTTKKGQKVLDQLTGAFRHLDKDELKVKLKGGGEIRGDELKLSTKIQVLFSDGSIDEGDLYTKMSTWLADKIQLAEVDQDIIEAIISEA
ncbi:MULTISPECIES: hypothetical protein [Pseudoalteromonas]|nr:hypothetical protein [Pseudoalteromonas sp. A757]RXE87262.1 hypothetical protein DRB05_08190 [Pseudoalteromonas sp. A757]